MKSILKNKEYFIYLYYAIFLLIVTFRTSEDAPNTVLRFGFLAAFFLPLIYRYQYLLPACLLCFFTIGTYGFAYNFFPYDAVIYFVIGLIAFILNQKGKIFVSIKLIFYFVVTLLIVSVNIVDSGSPQDIGYGMMTFLLLGHLANRGSTNTESSFYLMNGFSFASLSLSLIYLLNYKRFMVSYNAAESLDRSGWIDPNYFSCVIGMGVLASLILLLKYPNKFMKTIWLLALILSIIVQLLLASRGGLLASFMGIIIILSRYKISIYHKLLISICIVVFLSYLYASGVFDLLMYRIADDDGTGSGRTTIWLNKLEAFLDEGNPFQWIFGMGYMSAFFLCGYGSIPIGFHNDFVAVLCGYGFVGLGIFLYMFQKIHND